MYQNILFVIKLKYIKGNWQYLADHAVLLLRQRGPIRGTHTVFNKMAEVLENGIFWFHVNLLKINNIAIITNQLRNI